MIKIVTAIHFSNPGKESGVWTPIPMIPASASVKSDITSSSSGRLKTVSLDFKVYEILPGMKRDVTLKAVCDDGTVITIGNNELPAELDINESDVISVSCKWSAPDMI